MTTRIAALEAVAEAARKWKLARTALSAERPRTLPTNRNYTEAQIKLDKAIDALNSAPADIDDSAAERAKIVAWLREVADGCSGAHFRSTLFFIANAIDCGEHDKAGAGK